MTSDIKGSLLLAWQVKQKHCLVIGSGDVALSRINHLIIAQAKISVITGSGHIHPTILQLNDQHQFEHFITRDYQSSDLSMLKKTSTHEFNLDDINNEEVYNQISHNFNHERFEIICCCIDDYQLSTQIYYQCKYLHLNCNIADKPLLCDFYFGSMINEQNFQILISTNGKSPRFSKILKDLIYKGINDNVEGDLNFAIENLGNLRLKLRQLKLQNNHDLITFKFT
ncbi:putative NAD(P)-binding-domain-containing protein [Scheffersomyces coipomensis]|uniref:putative NAD(P)-binding-domain-containing protein n=1 Tax=Scheffersomyces coipomensis TaxID=1788519 RepID=UPI00315D1B60